MSEWFRSGGIMMWPILIAGGLVIILSIRAALVLRAASTAELRRGRADAVLFWGAFAALIGVLGTLVGITQISRIIGAANEADSGLVWSGVGVALTTMIFGLLVLLVAMIIWYFLQQMPDRTTA